MDPLNPILNRRSFLANSAKAGLVLGAPGVLRAAGTPSQSDTLNLALVGCGRQGRELFQKMRNIPGIRVQAVCDIWDQNRKYARHLAHRHQGNEAPNDYVDFEDMLEKENGLDAAIIATPDFWHAPHAVRCMEAGLHVYCESMMAHTLEAAREIVRASDRTRRLCQIGHAHRSCAVYRFVRNRLINSHRICGNIHNINSQWNASINSLQSWIPSKRLFIDENTLRQFGYAGMEAFMNWEQFIAHSQGRLARFTSRQMDVIHWFLDVVPKSLTVFAGRDYFTQRESYDNLMCIFQYDTPHGSARVFHQSLTSMNDPEIRFEKFIGPDATIRILGAGERTEIRNKTSDDESGRKLAELEKSGVLKRSHKLPCYLQQENMDAEMGILSHETTPPIPYELPGKAPRPALEAHLRNFFDAIHGREQLNCDARTAFLSEAAIYWLHAATESGGTLHFTPEQLAI